MCGRFTIITDPTRIMERFLLEEIPFELLPRFNIAPGQFIPAIIGDGVKRRIGQLQWGLIPSWSADDKSGYKMINAKAETIQERSSFKQLFVRKRCLIPADGFYEWKQTPNGKQPMRIVMKEGNLFAFAGLYDTWIRTDGSKLSTCTIITTKPNKVVAGIHDRMPVILSPSAERMWLDRQQSDPELLQTLLAPYNADEMRAYPVSPIVGNTRNDKPDCIAEITAPL